MTVHKASRVLMALDHKALQVQTAHKALQVKTAHKASKELQELKAQQVLRVQ